MATALRIERTMCLITLQSNPFESDARAVRSAISNALDEGASQIVVDCGGWDRLDLLALSGLVQGAKKCQMQGASFELVNLSRPVRASIHALRLDHRLGLAA